MMRWTLALLATAALAQSLDLPKTVRQGGTLRLSVPATSRVISVRTV